MKLMTLIKAITLIVRNPKKYSGHHCYIHFLTGEIKFHFWQIDSKYYMPYKLWEAYTDANK